VVIECRHDEHEEREGNGGQYWGGAAAIHHWAANGFYHVGKNQ
jgi:hypothetical protein